MISSSFVTQWCSPFAIAKQVALACIALSASAILTGCGGAKNAEYDAACAGPPLKNSEAREQAQVDGYNINRVHDCIDKVSFEAVAKQRVLWEEAQIRNAEARAAREAADKLPPMPLATARANFKTQIAIANRSPTPLPTPPRDLFIRSDYLSDGRRLAAYVTPDKGGGPHPAIIWLTGGDTNSLDEFWIAGPPSNDQSASAFRNSDVVMMFPTLRGGNTNEGKHEYFMGEVDDVLAAAAHLRTLSYVDPNRIFLGGHSTGGTLALVVAEMGAPFAAVFAFGPIAEVNSYGNSIVPINFSDYPVEELRLRSPIRWLHGITVPTYLIEGTRGPSNMTSLDELCEKSSSPFVHCVRVQGEDHFSVLNRVSRVIAARIAVSAMVPFKLNIDEFSKQ